VLARELRVGITLSSTFKMQRIPELLFSATLGEEQEVEIALV